MSLYDGEVTKSLDAERTLASMSTRTKLLAGSALGISDSKDYKPGEVVTLWQQGQSSVTVTIDCKIGEGASSKIYKVSNDGKRMALEVFQSTSDLMQLYEEAAITLDLSYPKKLRSVLSVEFIWVNDDTKEVFFLLDYVDGGDLQQWIAGERLYTGTPEEVSAVFEFRVEV